MKRKLIVCSRSYLFNVRLQRSVSLLISLSSAFSLLAQPPVKYDFFNHPSFGRIQIELPKPFKFEPVNLTMPMGLPGSNTLPGFNNNAIEEQNRRLLQEHGLLPGSVILHPPGSAQQVIRMAELERELMDAQFYKAHDEWWIKTKYYRQAYWDLMALNSDSFSLAQIQFIVENAWYYHESGQLWVEKEYKDNLLWNVIANYDASGKPMDKGTLKDGNGTVKYYDEKGKVYLIEYYEKGQKVKEENK